MHHTETITQPFEQHKVPLSGLGFGISFRTTLLVSPAATVDVEYKKVV
jgi:hypothetical protein